MDFEVNRENYRETRVVNEAQPAALEPGQIRLAIERYAVTTNNITYAVAGDMLDYWGFFPTEAPWGRVPAMGLASVVESANPDIELGGRYFGFYPMSDQSVISAKVHGDAFRDVGPHRANHAAAYTNFSDVSSDEMFREDKVDEYLLLRGMFMTSFLVDDYLDDNNFQGAQQTLVTSASSKTSISLAACLAKRGQTSVGLTSERNRSFVEGLGMYSQVITYDQVAELDASAVSGLVDMAGNAAVQADVHNHFGENLKFSITVGMTHWEAPPAVAALVGPTPEFFFAPGQATKRAQEWGPGELEKRMATALDQLLDGTNKWLTVEHHAGAAGATHVFNTLLEGDASPSAGFIVFPEETEKAAVVYKTER